MTSTTWISAACCGLVAAAAGAVAARPHPHGSTSGSIRSAVPHEPQAAGRAAPAARPMMESRTASVRAMDRNRDGAVTRAEWRGSTAAFRRLDRNGDGKITLGPAPSTAARKPARTTARSAAPVRRPTPPMSGK